MGNYDSIQVPIQGNVISSAQWGVRVRDAIVALDSRVSRIESTLSNYAYKTNTTTRANTTALSIDPDLQLWLEANSTYFVEFFLTVAAIPAEDIKTTWTIPALTSTTDRRVFGPGSTALDTNADNIAMKAGTHLFGTAIVYNGVRSSLALQFQIQEVAIVKTGATAGYTGIQWAQNTSGATGATVNSSSFCRATKIQ